MTALDPAILRLDSRHLETVRRILRQTLPNAEAWAFGSRVTGGGHEASDLDLVARNPADLDREQPGITAARTAFMESELPIRVDLLDWARLTKPFQGEILRGYVVIQGQGDCIARNFEELGV